MTREEADILISELRSLSFFKEIKLVDNTPNKSRCSFNLIGTKFFLDIVPINKYAHFHNYKLCWEKKQFLWQSYTFFDVIKEIPEELGNNLLFHINIFQEEGDFRYTFPGVKH